MPETMDKIKEKLHLGHKDEKEGHAEVYQPPPGPPPSYAEDAARAGAPPPHGGPSGPPYQQPPPAQYPVQKQYVAPPRPSAHLQQTGQNIGMMASVVPGGAGVGNMWESMAMGGYVGQQVKQAQDRAYWREQQNRYYSGLPAAGIGDPRVAEPMSDRERRRADRRKARWDRRAARRGIEIPPQPVQVAQPMPGAAPQGHMGGHMGAAPMAAAAGAAGLAAGHHGHHGGHGHHGHHHSSGHNTSGSESDHLSD